MVKESQQREAHTVRPRQCFVPPWCTQYQEVTVTEFVKAAVRWQKTPKRQRLRLNIVQCLIWPVFGVELRVQEVQVSQDLAHKCGESGSVRFASLNGVWAHCEHQSQLRWFWMNEWTQTTPGRPRTSSVLHQEKQVCDVDPQQHPYLSHQPPSWQLLCVLAAQCC